MELTTSSFLKGPAVLASRVLRLDGALVFFVPSVRKRGTVLPAELPGVDECGAGSPGHTKPSKLLLWRRPGYGVEQGREGG